MLSFIIAALLLTFLAIFMLVMPLLRGGARSNEARHTQNIEIARERLAEIEEQLAEGTISREDYTELKIELESTLASDLDLDSEESDKNSNAAVSSSTSNAVLITLLCCLLPVGAVITYLLTGDPAAVTRAAVAQPTQENQHQSTGLGTDINKLVESLEQRLEADGSDIQGWTILARTYRQLGRLADAVSAYRNLTELQPANPDVFAGLAEAISASRNGVLDDEARGAVAQVLSLNDRHAQGLWLAGMGALQQGEHQSAIDYWRRLRVEMEGYPEQQAELDQVIQETAQAGGLNSVVSPSVTSPDATNSASVADDTGSSSEGQIAIRVRAVLSESIANQVAASDTVFIIARARSGPPAPLAVKRLKVSDLPVSVTLTPEDAMLPQLSIANFPELELVARVSKSGQPIAQSGDIQSDPVAASNTETDEITLTIERAVE